MENLTVGVKNLRMNREIGLFLIRTENGNVKLALFYLNGADKSDKIPFLTMNFSTGKIILLISSDNCTKIIQNCARIVDNCVKVAANCIFILFVEKEA